MEMFHGDCLVKKIEWNPEYPNYFASSGLDHKIRLWDLTKDEEERMIFIHSGHKGFINDFNWNPCKDFELCSVDSKNQI